MDEVKTVPKNWLVHVTDGTFGNRHAYLLIGISIFCPSKNIKHTQIRAYQIQNSLGLQNA